MPALAGAARGGGEREVTRLELFRSGRIPCRSGEKKCACPLHAEVERMEKELAWRTSDSAAAKAARRAIKDFSDSYTLTGRQRDDAGEDNSFVAIHITRDRLELFDRVRKR